MNKLLEIHDNIIPVYIQDYLYNLIMGKIPNIPFPLYVSDNLSQGDTPDLGFNNNFRNTPEYKETILQVLYYLCFFRKINLKSTYQSRVFLQTKSNSPFIPKIHTDMDGSFLVCLYYVNDSDGDTLFYNDKQEIIQKVTPKKGRIALFDGSIYHSSGQPTQNERIVINICFNGEFYE